MGVVRQPSAASRSRHADVDSFPYSNRSVTGRQIQPKQTGGSITHYQAFNQVLTSPVLPDSGGFSPGADSWISVDSSETGTSHDLAARRGVSAVFYTPTSSTAASPVAQPETSSQSLRFWAEHQQYANQYNQHYHPDPSLSPPESLRGLGLPLKEQPPFGLQYHPPQNADVITFHTTSPPPRQTRPGVRWRPLSPDARENAGAVRDSGGSCIRCYIMRERCDTEVPCGRCVTVAERARSWKLPCSRKWLNERGIYLLPDILTTQLKIRNVDDFVNARTFYSLEGPPLHVPLSIGFGPLLIIDAVEVDPLDSALMTMYGFDPSSPRPFSLKSPPIIPIWPIDHNGIYGWVRDLLTQSGSDWPQACFPVPTNPAWQQDILHLICRYHQQSQQPPSSAASISSSNSSEQSSNGLETALRLSILAYVMGHALTIPSASVAPLFAQLQRDDFHDLAHSTPPNPLTCPRAINKVVKAVILLMVQHLVDKTFTALHLQIGPKPDKIAACFETAFSISFLTLTVLAQIQTSLYERAVSGAAQNPPDPEFGLADAHHEIARMDAELAQYVIYLFLHRYKPKRGGQQKATSPKANSPSINSNSNNSNNNNSPFFGTPPHQQQQQSTTPTFREIVQSILQRHKAEIRAAGCVDLNLGDNSAEGPANMEEDWFRGSGVRNITRVLARLCAPLIED